MSRRTSARAVFHDRDAVEEAVRALDLEGVQRARIHVCPAAVSEGIVHTPRESGSAASIGVGVGGAIGGVIAIVSLVLWRGPLPILDMVGRLVGGAGAGAIVGGLLALLGKRSLRALGHPAHTYPDFLVRVDADDAASLPRIRDLLTLAGGEPPPHAPGSA